MNQMTCKKMMAFSVLSLMGMGLAVSTSATSYVRKQPPLLQEAERQLSMMQTSIYQHRTDVDEVNGRYNYDCSGFLDYSLQKVRPEAYAELPISRPKAKRPLAQDFYTLFSSPRKQASHWLRIEKANQLRAGDVVAWLRPPDNDSNNTGHVMLVRDRPTLNPSYPNEILVTVMDSTTSPTLKILGGRVNLVWGQV
jgi:hypothetical protein